MHNMRGVGLSNVYLANGYIEDESGGISYKDIDGIFFAISLAIATRPTPLNAAELRFMRKRLALTQEQIGAIGGKSGQVAALWEKGFNPVPQAEGNFVRLAWLERYAKRQLGAAVHRSLNCVASSAPYDYVFRFGAEDKWVEDMEQAKILAQSKLSQLLASAIKNAPVAAADTKANGAYRFSSKNLNVPERQISV